MLYTRGWNSTFLRHKITGIQNLVFSKKAWIHLYSICDLFISDLHSTHQTTNLTSRICYFKSIISCVRNSHPILCFETIVGLDKKLVFFVNYCTCAIITHSLYILNPLFEGQKCYLRVFFRKILALHMVRI